MRDCTPLFPSKAPYMDARSNVYTLKYIHAWLHFILCKCKGAYTKAFSHCLKKEFQVFVRKKQFASSNTTASHVGYF